MTYTLDFSEIHMRRIAEVGSKNASLGEMFNQLASEGVRVPQGFAVTASAYWRFLHYNGFEAELSRFLRPLDARNSSQLALVGDRCRSLMLTGEWPPDVESAIRTAHERLVAHSPSGLVLAVHAAAVGDDLSVPRGLGELLTQSNLSGPNELLEACRLGYASLFADFAIRCRAEHGLDQLGMAVSIGVKHRVRSDLACSGVGYTRDPVTGDADVVVLMSAPGADGKRVIRSGSGDRFLLIKARHSRRPVAVVHRMPGDESGSAHRLQDDEVLRLAEWCLNIERHYGQAMEVEWAKDGVSGEVFIVRARPHLLSPAKDCEEQAIVADAKQVVL